MINKFQSSHTYTRDKKEAAVWLPLFYETEVIINYCASAIRNCRPALVFTIGAEVDTYGVTLR